MKQMFVFLAIGLIVLCHSGIKSEEISRQLPPVSINQDKPKMQGLSPSENAETVAHLLIANLTSLLITMFGIMDTNEGYSRGQILIGIGLPGFLFSAYALHEVRQNIQNKPEEQRQKIEENFNKLIGHEPDY